MHAAIVLLILILTYIGMAAGRWLCKKKISLVGSDTWATEVVPGEDKARAFEVHLANYWPEWGIKLIDDLAAGRYPAVQQALVREAMPFYKLWIEMEKTYTSGDGYLDKLCMELVGLDSSRCRPPTRDIRKLFRERTREMLIKTRVPRVLPS